MSRAMARAIFWKFSAWASAFGLEVHLGQFADPVDQFGHGFAELRLKRFLGNAGVFDHVMQHGRHQALMVHVHVGKNIRPPQEDA